MRDHPRQTRRFNNADGFFATLRIGQHIRDQVKRKKMGDPVKHYGGNHFVDTAAQLEQRDR